MSSKLDSPCLYFGTRVAVYIALFVLFQKTGVKKNVFNGIWWGWIASGDVVGMILIPFLWPLLAALSLLCWIGDYIHLRSKQKDALAKASKPFTPYSTLSDSELIASRRQLLKELDEEKLKRK